MEGGKREVRGDFLCVRTEEQNVRIVLEDNCREEIFSEMEFIDFSSVETAEVVKRKESLVRNKSCCFCCCCCLVFVFVFVLKKEEWKEETYNCLSKTLEIINQLFQYRWYKVWFDQIFSSRGTSFVLISIPDSPEYCLPELPGMVHLLAATQKGQCWPIQITAAALGDCDSEPVFSVLETLWQLSWFSVKRMLFWFFTVQRISLVIQNVGPRSGVRKVNLRKSS